MQDFETTSNDAENGSEQDECAPARDKISHKVKGVFRNIILFISFGPGVLGFLWLLGRILKP
jgi:hypothetical protein